MPFNVRLQDVGKVLMQRDSITVDGKSVGIAGEDTHGGVLEDDDGLCRSSDVVDPADGGDLFKLLLDDVRLQDVGKVLMQRDSITVDGKSVGIAGEGQGSRQKRPTLTAAFSKMTTASVVPAM
jgi:hypothetical protein